MTEAARLASTIGLESLSIGTLASNLGLSKSGLFAHFGSKENLQVQIIESATELFTEVVIRPAVREARGEPRVKALFENWLRWASGEFLPGGCIFVTAGVEFDDRPGPVRDALAETQRRWNHTLQKAADLAVEMGHFRPDLDAATFAFAAYGIMLSSQHYHRLLASPDAMDRARAAFEALLKHGRGDRLEPAPNPWGKH